MRCEGSGQGKRVGGGGGHLDALVLEDDGRHVVDEGGHGHAERLALGEERPLVLLAVPGGLGHLPTRCGKRERENKDRERVKKHLLGVITGGGVTPGSGTWPGGS